MQIKTISVTAGRTFNHPHEQYSNLRPEVTMTAELYPSEDAHVAVRDLQQRAERQAEARGLQEQLDRTQKRLEEIRAAHPELKLMGNGPEGA